MRTAIETARDGVTPLRVYHAAGKTAGANVEGTYQWTHAPDKETRACCVACTRGTIPAEVKSGKRRS